MAESFFDHMSDIFLNMYENYREFRNDIDRRREELLSANRVLLQDNHILLDFHEMMHVPEGRFDIQYEEIVFECAFHYKPEENLYVILNGSLTGEPPQFKRWSYYPFLNGSMLNIADPMYRIYDGLKLGWYYGNDCYDLRKYVVEVVKKVAYILKIDNRNIIFLASSGGGAAVIECASLMEGARSVAINPQIILSEYGYAKRFTEITQIDLNKEDIWNRNNAIYYLKTVKSSYHILIFNIRSNEDMEQVSNICKSFDISVKYGINVFKQLAIWLYDGECKPYLRGHSTQEYYCIVFVIEFLIKNIGKQEFEKRYDSFFRLINEFWYFMWQQEKKSKIGMLDLSKLVFCRDSKQTVVLWGGGGIAEYLSKELFDISHNNFYNIRMVIDNDESKDGKYFASNIVIKHPSSVLDWNDYFVIITAQDKKGISAQLEDMNLKYGENFIYWDDLFKV